MKSEIEISIASVSGLSNISRAGSIVSVFSDGIIDNRDKKTEEETKAELNLPSGYEELN